jgi:hypothetical protein
MTYERLAYDDQDTTVQMHLDCAACASQMSLPSQKISSDLLEQAPSLAYDAQPREIHKPEISVSEATAHLAARLHLHLD